MVFLNLQRRSRLYLCQTWTWTWYSYAVFLDQLTVFLREAVFGYRTAAYSGFSQLNLMPSKAASGSGQNDKGVRGGRGGRGSGGRSGRGRGDGSKSPPALSMLDAKKAAAEADWFKAAWRKDGHEEKSR